MLGNADPTEFRLEVSWKTGAPLPAEQTLRIAYFEKDPEGADIGPDTGEFVELVNVGDRPVGLEGWHLADARGTKLPLPANAALGPGGRLRVYTGSGSAGPGRYYVGRGAAVWTNTGDTIKLVSPDGTVRESVSYD